MAALVAAAVMPVSAQAAGGNKTYRAYSSWLAEKSSNDQYFNYDRFCLIDLDGDRVPELIGQYQYDDGVRDYIVCAYDGKKVNTETFSDGTASVGGFRGSVYYIPEKGKIGAFSVSSGIGEQYSRIYRVKNGKLKKLFDGEIDLRANTWTIGNKKVDKKTYEKKLNSSYNRKETKNVQRPEVCFKINNLEKDEIEVNDVKVKTPF